MVYKKNTTINKIEVRKTLEGFQYSVRDVAFSKDSMTLAASGYRTIELWDVRTGKLKHTLNQENFATFYVTSLAYSHDGKTLATSAFGNTIKIWDTSNNRLIKIIKAHNSNVSSLAFSPDGKTLASGSWDSNVKLWTTSKL